MLSPIASVSLGILFVAIAGTNVWLMLRASWTSQSPNRRATLLRLHRLGGYLFLALFSVLFAYMNFRVLGLKRGLPVAITLHSSLAFLLVPLLLAKVLIARHYKHYSGALLALGLAIFFVSFLLVSITAFPVLWSALTIDKVPLAFWITFIAVVLLIFGALLFRRPVGALLPLAGRGVSTSSQSIQNGDTTPESANKKSLLLLLSRIQAQTHDSRTLRFLLPPGNGFHPRPGQFLTFNWMVGGRLMPRSYSICSSPLQKGYLEITVKRAPGGCVSQFLNSDVQLGLTVEARGPSGRFCFDERQHRKIVLIAGGSGITPMMSMLRYIDDLGLATDVMLLYFVRTPADIVFANELAQFRASIRHFHYLVITSQPDQDWAGPAGHLSRELLEAHVTDLKSSTFFLCGPKGLMESARNILHSLEVPDVQILQESFGGKTSESGPAEGQGATGTLAFDRSGRSCPLAEGRTLLDAAEAGGMFIPSSCRQGQCGTCAVRLLRGEVQMESEDGLSPALKARGYILACVSRAAGDIVLDL
jgi:glycine betaine catabolism B